MYLKSRTYTHITTCNAKNVEMLAVYRDHSTSKHVVNYEKTMLRCETVNTARELARIAANTL